LSRPETTSGSGAGKIADVIQNLMSALDHLAYQIVCVGTGDAPPKPRRIYFPIADSAAEYDAVKVRRLQGARPRAIEAIDALKPYKGGNDLLWTLPSLNNLEKHRLLLTVGSAYRSLDLGAVMTAMMHEALPDVPIPAMSAFFRPADVLFPLKEGDQLFIDRPGAKVNEQMQFRFDVALREPGIIEAQSVLEVLGQLSRLVDGIVITLRGEL
jgi:hypothetical protein